MVIIALVICLTALNFYILELKNDIKLSTVTILLIIDFGVCEIMKRWLYG